MVAHDVDVLDLLVLQDIDEHCLIYRWPCATWHRPMLYDRWQATWRGAAAGGPVPCQSSGSTRSSPSTPATSPLLGRSGKRHYGRTYLRECRFALHEARRQEPARHPPCAVAERPEGQSTYVSTGCGPDCAVMSAVMHETAAACRPSPLSCVAACRPRVAARCPALHHIMPHWLPCYLPRALIAFGKHSQVRCAAMKRDAMKYDAMR